MAPPTAEWFEPDDTNDVAAWLAASNDDDSAALERDDTARTVDDPRGLDDAAAPAFWVLLTAPAATASSSAVATPPLPTRAQLAGAIADRLFALRGVPLRVFRRSGGGARRTFKVVPDTIMTKPPPNAFFVTCKGQEFECTVSECRPGLRTSPSNRPGSAGLLLEHVRVLGLNRNSLTSPGELVQALLAAAGEQENDAPGAKLLYRSALGQRDHAGLLLPRAAAAKLQVAGAIPLGTRESLTVLPANAGRPALWLHAARERAVWLHNVRGSDASVLRALRNHPAFDGTHVERAGHLLSKQTGKGFGVVEVVLAAADDARRLLATSLKLHVQGTRCERTVYVSKPGTWLCYKCGHEGHDFRRCSASSTAQTGRGGAWTPPTAPRADAQQWPLPLPLQRTDKAVSVDKPACRDAAVGCDRPPQTSKATGDDRTPRVDVAVGSDEPISMACFKEATEAPKNANDQPSGTKAEAQCNHSGYSDEPLLTFTKEDVVAFLLTAFAVLNELSWSEQGLTIQDVQQYAEDFWTLNSVPADTVPVLPDSPEAPAAYTQDPAPAMHVEVRAQPSQVNVPKTQPDQQDTRVAALRSRHQEVKELRKARSRVSRSAQSAAEETTTPPSAPRPGSRHRPPSPYPVQSRNCADNSRPRTRAAAARALAAAQKLPDSCANTPTGLQAVAAVAH